MRKLIFIIIILAIGLGIAGFWYWQRNPYSKEILKLEILGPAEAKISEEVEYTVKYKNNGNVRLEEPRLIFEFPEHTLLEEGFVRRREIGPEELGDIYPGEEKTFKFRGRLFGKEGDLKTVKAWLSYRPKNLQARYESSTTFTTKIRILPITFNFDLPSRIEAGRNFGVSLNYYSSLDYPLSDLAIRVEYPDGFEFIKSTPSGPDKTEWEISLLNKAEGGRIEILGKLSGELGEYKIFKAQLGIWIEGEFVLLKEVTRGLEITEPRLSIFQTINGQTNYIASPGDLLHYEIYFRNIGEEPFKDLFLVTKLNSQAFDTESIRANNAQFEKGDNSIIWDWRNVSKLRFLGQGEEGRVEFWINLKKDWEISSPEEKNALLKNTVLVSKVKEEFENKVNSKLAIEQSAVSENGVYTINWRAKNYFNDVKNIKVKAVLPSNVNLTGEIIPQEQSPKFSFDSQSREIVWMIGDMEAGEGILTEPPTISFQVQPIGKIDKIIGEAKITGEDQWTEMFIESKAKPIDK